MLTLMMCTLQLVVFRSRMKYAVAIIELLLLLVLVVPAILGKNVRLFGDHQVIGKIE